MSQIELVTFHAALEIAEITSKVYTQSRRIQAMLASIVFRVGPCGKIGSRD